MKDRKQLHFISLCACDAIMPFGLVYIFYVILHGHLSPGGGFQGGVLTVAIIVFMYLAYGHKKTTEAISLEFMRKTEGVAVTAYIAIAMLGVVFGAKFCQNFAYANGNIGDLFSAGTIEWMDEAVGLNVLTGVSVLALSMFGLLNIDDEEDKEDK